MKPELPCKTAVKFSLVMLAGALVGTIAGGLFTVLAAAYAPDFWGGAVHPRLAAMGVFNDHAFWVGMVWGCFVGLAVSGFACFLATGLGMARILAEGFGKARKPEQQEKEATAQQP